MKNKYSKIFITFLISLIGAIGSKAQMTDRESILTAAKIDAYKFHLSKVDLKKFKRSGRKSTSDFFKPLKENISDSTLVDDSLYVKKYREITYRKTLKRHNVAYYTFLGVSVYAASVLVTLILLATG